MLVPASQRGLKQRCDAHTEEDGPNELTGGPLVKAHTHGLGEEERYCDSSTETCQVVLQGQATDLHHLNSNYIQKRYIVQIVPKVERSTEKKADIPTQALCWDSLSI